MAAPMDNSSLDWKPFVDDYLLQAVPDKLQVGEISKIVQKHNIKFHSIVEYLEKPLTSQNVLERCKGTQLLADILHSLPKSMLQHKELEFITAFFCDRMKDHHSVLPHVLYGLLTLSRSDNLGDTDAVRLLQALFQDVHTQSQVQSDRRNIFTLFATLLNTKLQYLVHILGVNFVFGYLQAIDGEKDPRNLTIIFSTLPSMLRNFPLGELTEDLFEVVSCYFPIDFQPPSNNPFGITRADLEEGLRKCMTALPAFAEYCLPLLQEKLDSNIIEAKVDALILLRDGAGSYGLENIATFLPALWSILRKEFFASRNNEVVSALLQALCAIVKCASNDLKHDAFEPFISTIIKECKHHVIDNDDVLRHGGAKLLEAVAAGLGPECGRVFNIIIPIIVENYGSHSETVKKDLIGFITDFWTTYSLNNKTDSGHHSAMLSDIFHLLMSEVSSSMEVIQTSSIAGLAKMIEFSSFSAEMVSKLCSAALDLSLMENSIQTVDNLSKLLKVLSKHHPSLTEEIIIKTITPSIGKFEKLQVYEIFTAVSSPSFVMHKPLKNLVGVITNLSQSRCNEDNIAKLTTVVKCLEKVLHNVLPPDDIVEVQYIYDNVLILLFDLSIYCVRDNKESTLAQAPDLVQYIASSIRIISQNLNGNLAHELVELTLDLFHRGKKSPKLQFIVDIPADGYLVSSTNTSLIFEAVVGSLTQPTIQSCFGAKNQDFLAKLLYHCNDIAICRCLASILNKLPPNDATKQTYDQLLDTLKTNVAKVASCNTLIWMCKAAVMASSPVSQSLTKKLLELLPDPSLGSVVAEGFGTIVGECKESLNSASHAQIRMLYKQRFFMQTNEDLIVGLRTSAEKSKPFFLKALTNQLKDLPQQVILADANKLIPVLIKSLSLQMPETIESSLQSTILFMNKHPEAFSEYIQDLVPKLLMLSEYQGNLVIRKMALNALTALTKQQTYLLLPFKAQVVKSLGRCLGNHKRQVRQAAALARCEWFLVGSAGS